MGHLRLTVGYPRVTIGHLRVTIGYFLLISKCYNVDVNS